MKVDLDRGFLKKPKPQKGYRLESGYCECGCKRSYWKYKKIEAMKKEKTTALPKIKWLPRYSETMEDDKQGRWARVAWAGDTKHVFFNGKPCQWEIAWVKKLDSGSKKFFINYLYPSNGGMRFDTLKECQKEVEKTFRWFMKCCNKK